jgi:hypothetical protein
LMVLTELFLSDVVLFVERGQTPDIEQIRLVERLKSIDSEGFGAIGWPKWYKNALGFY